MINGTTGFKVTLLAVGLLFAIIGAHVALNIAGQSSAELQPLDQLQQTLAVFLVGIFLVNVRSSGPPPPH